MRTQDLSGNPYSVGTAGASTACTAPPTSPQQLPALKGFTLGSSDPRLRPRGISERRLPDSAAPLARVTLCDLPAWGLLPWSLLVSLFSSIRLTLCIEHPCQALVADAQDHRRVKRKRQASGPGLDCQPSSDSLQVPTAPSRRRRALLVQLGVAQAGAG